MSDPIRKIVHSPESYSPTRPEILNLASAGAFQSDTIVDPYNGGEPPRTTNRILNYRRIQNWENYFLASAICSVAEAVVGSKEPAAPPELENALFVGVWPLAPGTYDPALDGLEIKNGTRIYGLFDQSYAQLSAPASISGYTAAAGLEDMAAKTFYILTASSGFQYMLLLEYLVSVIKEKPAYSMGFFSAITGDMFAYLYSADANSPVPCDSGITNYFFVPQVIKKAYAAFGHECIYISNAQIKKDFRTVMNAIKASVDKGIPVLAWGIGNVTFNNGKTYDPLPEGSLIGGYDKNDLLYVNVYPGPDRLSVYDDGYTAISCGLDTTFGLFFVGREIEPTNEKQVFFDAINQIPTLLTLPPSVTSYPGGNGVYLYGKAAFDKWAETLLDDSYYSYKTDAELESICWNLHTSPYCCVCTSDAYNYVKTAAARFPELALAVKLTPLYERMTKYKDDIWALHGDFTPPMEKFRLHEFRAQIAEILYKMGELCNEIVETFAL